jgi:hypothetical protein
MTDRPGWRCIPRRAAGPAGLVLAWGAWLAVTGVACTAHAAGHLALGLERLTFHDEGLADAYGARIGLTVAGDLLERRWMNLGLRASYLSGDQDAPHPAFITDASTEMFIVPVRLQWRLRHALGTAVEVWGGPELSWAGFRESWEADVPAAGIAASQTESGSWLGLGGIAGLRVRVGSVGHLRGSFEWVWADAARAAAPGNSNQENEMDGGWSGFALLWEPPWLEF